MTSEFYPKCVRRIRYDYFYHYILKAPMVRVGISNDVSTEIMTNIAIGELPSKVMVEIAMFNSVRST